MEAIVHLLREQSLLQVVVVDERQVLPQGEQGELLPGATEAARGVTEEIQAAGLTLAEEAVREDTLALGEMQGVAAQLGALTGLAEEEAVVAAEGPQILVGVGAVRVFMGKGITGLADLVARQMAAGVLVDLIQQEVLL